MIKKQCSLYRKLNLKQVLSVLEPVNQLGFCFCKLPEILIKYSSAFADVCCYLVSVTCSVFDFKLMIKSPTAINRLFEKSFKIVCAVRRLFIVSLVVSS